jgi:YVTN family beta-propeller protein
MSNRKSQLRDEKIPEGECYMSRRSPRTNSPNNPRISRWLVGLLAAGLSVPALAQSNPFPTYTPGENTSASTGPTYSAPLSNPWVVSDGTILTPAGTQVYLGTTTRAKAIALNPNTVTHTAAVLQMGAPQAVTIFNTQTGDVLQTFSAPYVNSKGGTSYDSDGSQNGIAYTPDGSHLLFSQDGYNSAYKSGSAYVTIANVDPVSGLITSTGGANPYPVQVSVPIDINSQNYLTNVTCFSNSPGGTTGSINIPCGQTVSIVSDSTFTSYPVGIAISADATTAYAVLDNNDTLTKINLTAATPVEGPEVRVGNVPHSVVISPDGTTAYVSNEGGRIATAEDFQGYSNGTPVVAAYPTGSTATGTVSVVNLSTFAVTGSIKVGLHPTGMALWGKKLLVANTYDDSISVIDTTTNQQVWTINLGLPGFGVGPDSIAVDAAHNIAYVALYNANSVAMVNLNFGLVEGLIPVGYAPSSVVLDAADGALLVANDKGLGTAGFAVAPPPPTGGNTAENSYAKEFGVWDLNTHQDLGTASVIPIPNFSTLGAMTLQVVQNNHWDLVENILSAGGGNRFAKPVAIPNRIGDPSLIKHVFVIIRENRTYDQMLGDVVGGNGDPSLAVFGDNLSYVYTSGASGAGNNNIGTQPAYAVTPNAHAIVQRFPLLDNFYDPSRQSADGHNWITQAMAPYSDDIQSPDWLRDYPSNGGEALAYQKVGHLWDQAVKAGVSLKNYGEYIEHNTFNVPSCTPTLVNGFVISNSCEPTWTQFYNDTLLYESGNEPELQYYNVIGSVSPLPNLIKNTVQRYPQFDLGIPDQYRFDVWNQDFQNDVNHGTVPQLEFMWISSDHTGGPPTAQAMQADNDLALGRFVDAISHSPVWSSSAIFVEEDDAQTGVDHVDGHRSPGYIISPYVHQVPLPNNSTPPAVVEDSTFYTQVNMTRTIEQILGLTPMNQNDLVASPMRTVFINNPPPANFAPWTHVQNQVSLCQAVLNYTDPSGNPCPSSTSVANASPAVKALEAAWQQKKAKIFAGKYHIPDSEDPDIVRHYDWYDATGYRVPYPGEKMVRWPSDFKNAASAEADDDGD